MGEWRYSSTILYLGTRWRWVVYFTPLPLYPLRNHLIPPTIAQVSIDASRHCSHKFIRQDLGSYGDVDSHCGLLGYDTMYFDPPEHRDHTPHQNGSTHIPTYMVPMRTTTTDTNYTNKNVTKLTKTFIWSQISSWHSETQKFSEILGSTISSQMVVRLSVLPTGWPLPPGHGVAGRI
jgi:hypothetical protein